MTGTTVLRFLGLTVLLTLRPVGGLPQARTAEAALIPASAALVIRRSPGTPLQGADPETADVVLVEYFDYDCPYCKKLEPALRALLATDRKVALIYKDWPILGDDSKYAAGLGLAAKWQDKYLVAHDALLAGPRLSSKVQIEGLLQAAGIDLAELKKARLEHTAEIEALLTRNDTEARALGLHGTPALIVGRERVPFTDDVTRLRDDVARARAPGSRTAKRGLLQPGSG